MTLSSRERAPIDRVVSRLLVTEVDATLWAEVSRPQVAEIFDRLTPGYADWVAAGFDEERDHALRTEFASLFLLPKGAAPYASAWLEGDREGLGNQLASFVHRALAALGRELRDDEPWGRLALDHLGLLLELVAHAAVSEDPETREIAEHIEREALGPWVAEFGRALSGQAQSPLYRSVGALLEALFARAGSDSPGVGVSGVNEAPT